MLSPKLKKKLIQARNRRHQIINEHAKTHQAEHQRIIEEEMERREASKGEEGKGEEEVWSAKTQEIRDKLRRKKRKSKDRWNRFAGTSDGGGRGR